MNEEHSGSTGAAAVVVAAEVAIGDTQQRWSTQYQDVVGAPQVHI